MGLLHNTVVSLKCFFQGRELIVDKAGHAMGETRVRSLGQEDPPREGNGNPLQDSCLVNSMGRGAWWVTVMGSQRVGHN